MTQTRNAVEPSHDGFLRAGSRELGRRIARLKLRRLMRQQDSDRAAALAALGQRAWQEKIDLAAFAGIRDRLQGLDARAGELSETTSKLEKEKAALEQERRTELEKFAVRRRAVEEKKNPVDAALRAARSKKGACEQVITQGQSRLAAIAGKLSSLDRDIASLGTSAAPDKAQRLAAAEAERSRLASEQGNLGAQLAKAREDLPGHGAEESRLAGESQKHAAQITAIEAEQKATVGHIDTSLSRIRSETQGASQQSSAVQKEQAAAFGSLGEALYDSTVRVAAIAEPVDRVAAIDRARSESRSQLDASMAESRTLAAGTMPKFWSVVVGVPLVLAGLALGAYRFVEQRSAPPAATPSVATTGANTTGCAAQPAPDQGEGKAVTSDCTRSEGTFLEGRLHGIGKKTWANGESMEGTFHGGYLYGPGVRVYRDGRRFEGTFSGGRPIGQGKLSLPDGTVYEGRFWGPALLGYGVRRSPDGEIVAGDWREGAEGRIQPFGQMLRVRRDGSREKIDAAELDPTIPKAAAAPSQSPPGANDKPY
ncbi:MAG: hypothetical protein ACXWHZ_11875 [Usitatibacter sp.]